MNLKLTALAAFSVVATAANADLVAFWDFNSNPSGSSSNPTALTDTTATYTATGILSASFTSNFPAANIGTFGGSTVNYPSGMGTATSGRSLAFQGGASNRNNGDTITFQIDAASGSLINLTDLSFATQRTGTGFNSNLLEFSTNGGTTFTSIGTYTPATSFATRSFSGLGITNASSVLFRFTFDGATSAAGNNRIDNLQFNGSVAAVPVQAVPEPFTMTLGVAAFGVALRRRAKRA